MNRLFLLALVFFLNCGWAQSDYPNKPVRMMVGFAAGRISDVPVWQNLGADPIVMTPEAFEAATAREIAKLAPVVKASGAKLE